MPHGRSVGVPSGSSERKQPIRPIDGRDRDREEIAVAGRPRVAERPLGQRDREIAAGDGPEDALAAVLDDLAERQVGERRVDLEVLPRGDQAGTDRAAEDRRQRDPDDRPAEPAAAGAARGSRSPGRPPAPATVNASWVSTVRGPSCDQDRMHQPLPSAGTTMDRSRARPMDAVPPRTLHAEARGHVRSSGGLAGSEVARVDAGRARYPARTMTTLLDLLDASVTRYGERAGARRCGSTTARRPRGATASSTRRSRIAAWRLRALDLEPGDRILTWSPSTPELPAAYYGAMRARPRPRAARPADVAGRGRGHRPGLRAHATSSSARAAMRPDPREAGLDRFPTTTVEALCAEPADDDPAFPPDWEARQAAWARPSRDEVFELVFTSGTTGTPKGVMLTHDNVVASIESFHRIVPPMEHRLVSLLPLSHLLEQAVGLYYALDVGADILYVRSRNPRVIFDALRDQRVTSMVVVPQVLDLFWSAIEREVEKRGRTAGVRPARGRSPGTCRCAIRPRLFRSDPRPARRPLPAVRLVRRVPAAGAPAGLGGPRRHGPAGLRRHRDRDRDSDDLRGPRPGHGRPRPRGHRDAARGRRRDPVPRPDRVQAATGTRPRRPPPRSPTTAGTGPATSAISTTPAGSSCRGRSKDMIVLPNGFNVYPEDIENALRIAGIRDAIAVETKPGRIEAVVLSGSASPGGATAAAALGGAAADPAEVRARSTRRSRPPTRPSGRTSGSPAGGCGPRTTSRGRTRSRSSAGRSRPGPRSKAGRPARAGEAAA